jgi:hypothetical protein
MIPLECAASRASAISIARDSNASNFQRTPRNAMLQGQPFQKLHGDEGFALLPANVMDGADVGVIQRGCGLGFE